MVIPCIIAVNMAKAGRCYSPCRECGAGIVPTPVLDVKNPQIPRLTT